MSTSTIDYDALARQHGGSAAVNLDALAAQHGGTVQVATPDAPKSWWEKAKDNFNAATQGAQPGDGIIKGAVQNFGAGVADNIRAVAHPLDTAAALLHSAAHPIDTAENLVHSAVNSPMRLAGNIGGGMLLGEGAGAAASAVDSALPAAVGRAALFGKTPEGAYESALKPSTALDPAERAAVINTGLKEGIPVSKGGLEKLQSQVDTLNQAIKDQIASDPTRPINTTPALRSLDDVRARFSNQVTPQPDLKEIDAVQKNFLNNSKIQPQGAGPAPASLGAADAQAMKQGTYRALGDKAYGEVKGASIEAQKSLARGLKEEIAAQFPEIGNLNAQESKLLDLQPVLERAVNRISNHQAVGLATPVVGTAAQALTGSKVVTSAAMMAKAVFDNPYVKSRLAIAISKGAKIPYASALAKLGAYSESLAATQPSSQDSTSGDSPNQPSTTQP